MKIDNDKIGNQIGAIDLLICASGFESRSTSFVKSVDSSYVKNAIAFCQQENYFLAEQNLRFIVDKISITKTIDYPKNKPFDTFEIINRNISLFIEQTYKGNKLNIVVDITAFTREILLILLRVLTMPYVIGATNVKFVYMPSQSYQEDWMTKGVREIRPILGYPGLLSPSKPSLLILLTGFEEERMRNIIDNFEPNYILLGKPDEESSINNELFIISERKCEALEVEYKHLMKEDCFKFSCQDISKTKKIILDLYNKYQSEYNIIIAPLNNKISTLGVAFAALSEEGIQVCYASANQYNIENSTTPSLYFYSYDVKDLLC